MKNILFIMLLLGLYSCNQASTTSEPSSDNTLTDGGQSTVQDDVSQQDVVRIAVNSKDHTTLVTALKTAEYVDALSNAGPFTVFAPTNEAFAKLPAGTVDNLLKPENKDALRNILEYHVYVGVLTESIMQDGMKLNQVNLEDIIITKKDGKVMINNATVLGSARASNGIVYIIDSVLLPPDKK
jgi:uncharacterized surface protein with fasciclin (FAS1) repeats